MDRASHSVDSRKAGASAKRARLDREPRDRILEAAAEEFAQHGVAGARTDRIARNAKTSKERVYAHFRGKRDLYLMVAERELATITEAVDLDPVDMPGYAGRVHDYFMARPEHLRLMYWGLLADPDAEGEDDPFREVLRETLREGSARVAQAQADGLFDPSWDPIDVVVLVNHLAISWVSNMDLADVGLEVARDPGIDARRAAVVESVARLFPPAGTRSNSARLQAATIGDQEDL